MDALKTFRRFEAFAVVKATLCVAWKVKCAAAKTMTCPTMAHPVWKALHVPLASALQCLHQTATTAHHSPFPPVPVSHAVMWGRSNVKVTPPRCKFHAVWVPLSSTTIPEAPSKGTEVVISPRI
jgi:hypothetical protein